jgi:hypothetical protein
MKVVSRRLSIGFIDRFLVDADDRSLAMVIYPAEPWQREEPSPAMLFEQQSAIP